MKISQDFELQKYPTFEPSKEKPIYSWFYYKEAFSPEIVEWVLRREKDVGIMLDPYCGIGTSLLTAKSHQLQAIGFDISPLAVLVSKVKCENYDKVEIDDIVKFLDITNNLPEPTVKWEFELFSPRAAFPKSHYNALLSLRIAIDNVENEKVRDLLLVALLSIIPQVGIFIKDGGVLKIDKSKSAMPVKEAFKRKIKKIVNEIENNSINGPVPRVERADARDLNKVENESVDLIVTSPPYLNNVDYTKVYGLELSLMFLDRTVTKQVRGEAVRSFITSNLPPENVPQEVGEIGYKIPVIGNYFSDMEKTIKEAYRVLKPGGACYLVIGNTVIYGTHIFVDEVLGEIAERIGMQCEIVVAAERIADVKPRKVKIRESIVIMKK